MSKDKFTPDPWTAKRDIQGGTAFRNGRAWNPNDPRECRWAVYGQSSRILCMEDAVDWRPEEEQAANAQLIAAAPAAVRAMREIVRLTENPADGQEREINGIARAWLEQGTGGGVNDESS